MRFGINTAAQKKQLESSESELDSLQNIECIWSAESKGNNLHILYTLSYIFMVRFLCLDNEFDCCLGWPNMGNYVWDLLGQAFLSVTYNMFLYLTKNWIYVQLNGGYWIVNFRINFFSLSSTIPDPVQRTTDTSGHFATE